MDKVLVDILKIVHHEFKNEYLVKDISEDYVDIQNIDHVIAKHIERSLDRYLNNSIFYWYYRNHKIKVIECTYNLFAYENFRKQVVK